MTQPAKKAAPRKTTAAGKGTPTRSRRAATSARRNDDVLAALRAELEKDGSPIGPDGEVRPVKIGESKVEMTTIFELDDVEYQIPKNPSPALLMQFQKDAQDRKIGTLLAAQNLLIDLLGDEGMRALKDPRITDEDCARVFYVVGLIGFGALDRLKEAVGPS